MTVTFLLIWAAANPLVTPAEAAAVLACQPDEDCCPLTNGEYITTDFAAYNYCFFRLDLPSTPEELLP